MKTCFCGCGRSVSKFPLGRRSINARGRTVSERLAYMQAMRHRQPPEGQEVLFSEVAHGDPEWYEHGPEIIADIRAAMHGETDPRALDPDDSGRWLAYGRNAEAVEVRQLGSPPINVWLRDQAAQNAVAKLAQEPLG
jgi:hypothetical protein